MKRGITEGQINFLNYGASGKWSIDENWLVNVDGHFFCNAEWSPNYTLDGFMGLNFGRIEGDFIASAVRLTSLKGCPRYVGRNFDVEHNLLRTTKHSPEWVGLSYRIQHNSLVSLEDLHPDNIGGKLYFFNERVSVETLHKIWGFMKKKKTIFEVAVVSVWNDIPEKDQILLDDYLPKDIELYKSLVDYGIIK